jgi:hypothetical protein
MLLYPDVFHCDSFAKYALPFLGIRAPARSAVTTIEAGSFQIRVVLFEPFRWSGGSGSTVFRF